jgi:hypothetical protein
MEAIRYLFDAFPNAIYLEATKVDQVSQPLGLFGTYVYTHLTPLKLARHRYEAFEFFEGVSRSFDLYCDLSDPLLCAIKDDQSLGVIKLLASRWSADYKSMRDDKNNTPLHHACTRGRLDVVNFLIQKWPLIGLNANDDGNFPLDLLLETHLCTDRDSLMYVEVVWRLSMANPQAIKVRQ